MNFLKASAFVVVGLVANANAAKFSRSLGSSVGRSVGHRSHSASSAIRKSRKTGSSTITPDKLQLIFDQTDSMVHDLLQSDGTLDLMVECTEIVYKDDDIEKIVKGSDFDNLLTDSKGDSKVLRRSLIGKVMQNIRSLEAPLKDALRQIIPRLMAAKMGGRLDDKRLIKYTGEVMQKIYDAKTGFFPQDAAEFQQDKAAALDMIKMHHERFKSIIGAYVSRSALVNASRRTTSQSTAFNKSLSSGGDRTQYLAVLNRNPKFVNLISQERLDGLQSFVVDAILAEKRSDLIKSSWTEEELEDVVKGLAKARQVARTMVEGSASTDLPAEPWMMGSQLGSPVVRQRASQRA